MLRTRRGKQLITTKRNKIMERKTVTSSNIAEIGYDPDLEILEIMFLRTSAVYQYFNVPQFMHERLMQADSHGVFFNAEIKGHYPEERIT